MRLWGGPSVGGAASDPPAHQEPNFWELKPRSAKGFSLLAVSSPAFLLQPPVSCKEWGMH